MDSTDDENGHVTFITRALCIVAAIGAVRAAERAERAGAALYAAGTALVGLLMLLMASARRLIGERGPRSTPARRPPPAFAAGGRDTHIAAADGWPPRAVAYGAYAPF